MEKNLKTKQNREDAFAKEYLPWEVEGTERYLKSRNILFVYIA
jgi:hypothetical protein